MRSKIVGIVVAICLCSALALNGCNSSQSTEKSGDAGVSMGVVNDTCPIMPDHAVDPEGPTAEFNGQLVGFCCAGCPPKWEAMTDAEKQAYVDAQAAGDVNMGVINATCPVRGGPVNEAVTLDYNGHKVGFCCAGCIDGWKEMTDEQKAAAINAAHEGDANLGAVGGVKEGACDGAQPCCGDGEKPAAPETVNPGVIGAEKEGGCDSGGCCSQTQQKSPILN